MKWQTFDNRLTHENIFQKPASRLQERINVSLPERNNFCYNITVPSWPATLFFKARNKLIPQTSSSELWPQTLSVEPLSFTDVQYYHSSRLVCKTQCGCVETAEIELQVRESTENESACNGD